MHSPRRVQLAPARRNQWIVLRVCLQDEHRVAVAEKTVFPLYRMAIRAHHLLVAHEDADQHQQRKNKQKKKKEQDNKHAEAITGIDEQARLALVSLQLPLRR